jgi:uncharacterized protein with FMN-binding domain
VSTQKKVLIAVGAVLGVILILGIVMWSRVAAERNRIFAVELVDRDLSQVADGSYRGGESFLGNPFEVEVAVKGKKIDAIAVLEDDGSDYSKRARLIAERVVKKQSLMVDAVTGATSSSKVLLNAINDALAKAAGAKQ